MQDRIIRLSFFTTEHTKDGGATTPVGVAVSNLRQYFQSLSEHRPTPDFRKDTMKASKAGHCFIGGYGATRGSIQGRSCLVLDADTNEAVDTLLESTRGYYRIMWETFKSGLRALDEEETNWTIDPSQTRIRIVLPLDRDITRGEWQHHGFRQVYDQTFPNDDDQTKAVNAMAYMPAGWAKAPDVIEEVGELYPADLLVRGTALTVNPIDYEDTATEVATPEHLSRLWETVRKREFRNGDSHVISRYLKAILKGEVICGKGIRHEASIKVCNAMATGLKECSVESILDLCMPTLVAMQLDGSDETRETWREKITSWRPKAAAIAKQIDFDLPGSSCEPGMTTTGEPEPGSVAATLGTHTEPIAVLNAAFALLPVPGSDHQIFQVFDGDVCELENSLDKLNTHVADFGKLFGKDDEQREWTSKAIRETVSLWKAIGRKLPSAPVASRFKSDPGYCFKRLPFDPTQGETPAWDEFCDRLSNADYFKAFVWTAFEPKNVGRQILWMIGNGQDGKSTVMGCIANALGAAAAAVDASDFTSTFGTSRLDGKRLVYIGDCKNPLLLTEANVRKVTSGDSIKVEFKGKTGYDKALRLKLMVMANIQPDITSARADESRLLPITVSESANKNDGKWHDRLAAELPAFLWDCRETYARICPDHVDFALDEPTRALVRKCSGLFEDDFAYIAGLKLRFTGNRKDKVSRPEFNTMMRDGSNQYRWTNKQCKDFWAYVQTKHNVETIFVEGNVFIAGCHMHNVPAQNPLTLVDNTAETVEDAACPL